MTQIENGKKTEFKQKIYAKKITVASNDVVFEEKLDMAQYNQNNRGNRTNLIHTGNLEFTNRGKVKFNKGYVGTITTSKANIGEVTFVNTPNIYEVGAVNKRIEKLTFTGYQFSVMDGINLMPNIGIRYNTYKDNAYTETGTGVNNMYVAGKSGNLTTGIAGIKLTAPKRLSNDTQIVLGLHASVENSFSNKQPKMKARFIWADNYFENTTSSSTPKVGYNVGASLLTAHKNIELLATYNCNLRSKYTSHQGSLKLKILF